MKRKMRNIGKTKGGKPFVSSQTGTYRDVLAGGKGKTASVVILKPKGVGVALIIENPRYASRIDKVERKFASTGLSKASIRKLGL